MEQKLELYDGGNFGGSGSPGDEIGLLCLNGTDKVNIMSQDQITNHCFSKQLKVLNTCRLSPLAQSLVSPCLSGWNKYYWREIL